MGSELVGETTLSDLACMTLLLRLLTAGSRVSAFFVGGTLAEEALRGDSIDFKAGFNSCCFLTLATIDALFGGFFGLVLGGGLALVGGEVGAGGWEGKSTETSLIAFKCVSGDG